MTTDSTTADKKDVDMKDAEVKDEVKEEVKEETETKAEGEEDVPMEEEEKAEEKKEEKAVEKEEDEDLSVPVSKFSGDIVLAGEDSSINAIVSPENILSSIAIGGQALHATTRSNVGFTTGRYMVECQVLSMHNNNHSEIRIGVSTEGSKLHIGTANSVGFSVTLNTYQICQADGTLAAAKRNTKRINQGDVIGLLVNRVEEGNANTVSLFVNGERNSQPVTLPDAFVNEAAIPTFTVKNSTIQMLTLENLRATYPFACRSYGMVADKVAESYDIPTLEEGEVVIPIGNPTKEWVDKYIDSHKDHPVVNLTSGGFQEWATKSSVAAKNQGRPDAEAQKYIEKIMNMKRRKYLYAFSNNLIKKDRKAMCKRLGSNLKITAFVSDDLLKELPKSCPDYKNFSIPMNAQLEGFHEVKFSKNMKESKDVFQSWLLANRLHSKVEGLKPSPWYREKMAEWNKFKTSVKQIAAKAKHEEAKKQAEEARKAEGGEEVKKEEVKEEKKEEEKKEEDKTEAEKNDVDVKEWSAEDWMLADLRYELHMLTFAFAKDVEELIKKKKEEKEAKEAEAKEKGEDKEAEKKEKDSDEEEEEEEPEPPHTQFTVNNLDFYYRLYFSGAKLLQPVTWGCTDLREVCQPIADLVNIGEEDDIVSSKMVEEFGLSSILELTESARQERKDRQVAGDENAVLKFKAPVVNTTPRFNPGQQNKGTSTTTAKGNPQMQNQQNKGQQWGNYGKGGYKGYNQYQPYGKGKYGQDKGGGGRQITNAKGEIVSGGGAGAGPVAAPSGKGGSDQAVQKPTIPGPMRMLPSGAKRPPATTGGLVPPAAKRFQEM